jgi:hypothetical protein
MIPDVACMLLVGSVEPFEGFVGFCAHRQHFDDLIGGAYRVLSLQRVDLSISVGPSPRGIVSQCETSQPKGILWFEPNS